MERKSKQKIFTQNPPTIYAMRTKHATYNKDIHAEPLTRPARLNLKHTYFFWPIDCLPAEFRQTYQILLLWRILEQSPSNYAWDTYGVSDTPPPGIDICDHLTKTTNQKESANVNQQS